MCLLQYQINGAKNKNIITFFAPSKYFISYVQAAFCEQTLSFHLYIYFCIAKPLPLYEIILLFLYFYRYPFSNCFLCSSIFCSIFLICSYADVIFLSCLFLFKCIFCFCFSNCDFRRIFIF